MEERKVFFPPDMETNVEKAAEEQDIAFNEFVRRAVADALNPKPVEIDDAMAGTDIMRAPFLTAAPCGPFQEALVHGGRIDITHQMARIMDAIDGDVFVRAMGQSMEGAGIKDGSWMLMRPVTPLTPPDPGDICLVQIVNQYDEYSSTVKYFDPVKVELRDGAGEVVKVPEGTKAVQPVAVLKAVITKF
jgi:SOS-response transcriptional repressor LexA